MEVISIKPLTATGEIGKALPVYTAPKRPPLRTGNRLKNYIQGKAPHGFAIEVRAPPCSEQNGRKRLSVDILIDGTVQAGYPVYHPTTKDLVHTFKEGKSGKRARKTTFMFDAAIMNSGNGIGTIVVTLQSVNSEWVQHKKNGEGAQKTGYSTIEEEGRGVVRTHIFHYTSLAKLQALGCIPSPVVPFHISPDNFASIMTNETACGQAQNRSRVQEDGDFVPSHTMSPIPDHSFTQMNERQLIPSQDEIAGTNTAFPLEDHINFDYFGSIDSPASSADSLLPHVDWDERDREIDFNIDMTWQPDDIPNPTRLPISNVTGTDQSHHSTPTPSGSETSASREKGKGRLLETDDDNPGHSNMTGPSHKKRRIDNGDDSPTPKETPTPSNNSAPATPGPVPKVETTEVAGGSELEVTGNANLHEKLECMRKLIRAKRDAKVAKIQARWNAEIEEIQAQEDAAQEEYDAKMSVFYSGGFGGE